MTCLNKANNIKNSIFRGFFDKPSEQHVPLMKNGKLFFFCSVTFIRKKEKDFRAEGLSHSINAVSN